MLALFSWPESAGASIVPEQPVLVDARVHVGVAALVVEDADVDGHRLQSIVPSSGSVTVTVYGISSPQSKMPPWTGTVRLTVGPRVAGVDDHRRGAGLAGRVGRGQAHVVGARAGEGVRRVGLGRGLRRRRSPTRRSARRRRRPRSPRSRTSTVSGAGPESLSAVARATGVRVPLRVVDPVEAGVGVDARAGVVEVTAPLEHVERAVGAHLDVLRVPEVGVRHELDDLLRLARPRRARASRSSRATSRRRTPCRRTTPGTCVVARVRRVEVVDRAGDRRAAGAAAGSPAAACSTGSSGRSRAAGTATTAARRWSAACSPCRCSTPSRSAGRRSTPPVPLQSKKPLCVWVAKSQFEYALLSAMQYGQPMLPASRIWLSSS